MAVKGDERILGMYRLQANQRGRGAHVANAAYMVSPNAQGVGIGWATQQHGKGVEAVAPGAASLLVVGL